MTGTHEKETGIQTETINEILFVYQLFVTSDLRIDYCKHFIKIYLFLIEKCIKFVLVKYITKIHDE